MVSPFLMTAPLALLSFFWAFCGSCLDSDLGEDETCFGEEATREGYSLVSGPLLRTGSTAPALRFPERPLSLRFPDVLWLG